VTRPSDTLWPYNAVDNLTAILVRRKEKPLRFFYSNCKQHMHRWSTPPIVVAGSV
ncbi:hypothetical protein J1N35_041463, partial [Gossypium stocksii]